MRDRVEQLIVIKAMTALEIAHKTSMGNKSLMILAESMRDEILRIPEIAIVDREAELPKCETERNPLACGAEDDTGNCFVDGYEGAQQGMLRAGWVKELKRC